MTERHDAIVVGGGHNGLVASILLARAGLDVLVLERRGEVGGAAVSASPFPGVDARLSRYSYLVSLFPRWLLRELGVGVELRPRRGVAGRQLDVVREVADRLFRSLTEPLRSAAEMRRLVGDAAWNALFVEPLSELLEREIDDDEERGVALTDGLIGTFAPADDPELRQNRCFLYHVTGNGTGSWDVPVGGMGALSEALARAALRAGVVVRTDSPVVSVASDGRAAEVECAGGERYVSRHVLANVAPAVLDQLMGTDTPTHSPPEGSQLKLNMLLSRLPRPREPSLDAQSAFTGTFHVNEGYDQLQVAYAEAAGGRIPSLPPCEFYCHSLTDPTVLSSELRAAGAHTLTLFGLHMPARLFAGAGSGDAAGAAAAKDAAVAATLRSVNSVLAEPIEDCLWRDADGAPCLEALTPPEVEAELGMPGGHIFHRDLAWPFAESDEEVGPWGVETAWPNVWICGAGARRGGGVSGIPGHNAARAALATRTQRR
jgi:phytoene dehydrogenase-like protein